MASPFSRIKNTFLFVNASWLDWLFLGSMGFFFVGKILTLVLLQQELLMISFALFWASVVAFSAGFGVYIKKEPRGPLKIFLTGISLDESRWPMVEFKDMVKLDWGVNRHIVIKTARHQTLRLHFKTRGNEDRVFQIINEQMVLATKALPAANS